jgi:hypothetical protein
MSILDRVRARRAYEQNRGDRHEADRMDEPRERRDRHERVVEERARPTAVRARQREEFGGTNWGAAFFGWLVAVGIGALLTALASAAGAAIALSEFEGVGAAAGEAETIGLVGGIVLVVIALIAYFAGGYVAGRMSRFDGGRQGLAVWIWSLVIAVVLAVLGAVAGEEYNVFAALDLPRIPIDEGDLATGGLIALAAIVVGTALAAVAGGKAGERYHRRVDHAGHRAVERDREADTVAERDRRDPRPA